ncbi:hypothetical protein NSPZN2_11344 [Nitrospira defluvii]|uniref:Uncharacterized protein n=1 Tax=Nitrospira defluvii TaxID=330214 RepID=A0ABM8QT73_9BACT|nr:hypothetical protein NSPZN2_11344 [Nitrospira defluvii]
MSRLSLSGAFSRTNAGRPSFSHHEQITRIIFSYAVIPGDQQDLRHWTNRSKSSHLLKKAVSLPE